MIRALIKLARERRTRSRQIVVLPPRRLVASPRNGYRPHAARTDAVYRLLDEAAERGAKTYDQLIEYVRQHSSSGCSRKLVSRWKKRRAER